jgi:hypothetical protein
VVDGKGSKQRRLLLHPDLVEELGHFAAGRSGPLWLSETGEPMTPHEVRKLFYRLARRAGLRGIHPHAFRAGFATSFMERFGSLESLQVWLGHESPETTARYALTGREERATALMSEGLGIPMQREPRKPLFEDLPPWTPRACSCGCGRAVQGRVTRRFFDSGCRVRATRARGPPSCPIGKDDASAPPLTARGVA